MLSVLLPNYQYQRNTTLFRLKMFFTDMRKLGQDNFNAKTIDKRLSQWEYWLILCSLSEFAPFKSQGQKPHEKRRQLKALLRLT